LPSQAKHESVGELDGALDGFELGFAEGDELGFAEGDELGFAEGDELGFAEGDELGFAEGDELGFAEGDELGMAEHAVPQARKMSPSFSLIVEYGSSHCWTESAFILLSKKQKVFWPLPPLPLPEPVGHFGSFGQMGSGKGPLGHLLSPLQHPQAVRVLLADLVLLPMVLDALS